jgi:hypothetical protein
MFSPPQQPMPRRKGSPWALLGCSLIAMVIVGGIVVALLAGFGLFSAIGNIAMPNTKGPGWWKATAPGLGTFEFKTNSSQSAISQFVFQIPNISCPGITYSTTFVSVQESPAWSVNDGQFDADVEIEHDPAIDVEVSGTIASASQQASGTWIFDGESGPCQGSWTGVPSQ